jgi:hypothetical protein
MSSVTAISILSIFTGSLRWLAARWKHLALVLLIATAAFMAITKLVNLALSPFLSPGMVITQMQLLGIILVQLLIPAILVKSALAVYWLRHVLLDESGWPGTRHIVRMLGWSLVVTLVAAIVGVATVFAVGTPIYVFYGEQGGAATIASYIGISAGWLVVFLLLLRIIWVFPAIATGERFCLKTAWNTGRGAFLPVLGCVLLLALPLVGLLYLIGSYSLTVLDDVPLSLAIQACFLTVAGLLNAAVLVFIGHAYAALKTAGKPTAKTAAPTKKAANKSSKAKAAAEHPPGA